jgi:putative transcriptional regulator
MATVHDKLPAHQAQLLDALTPRGRERVARQDSDDPPPTHAELDPGITARNVRLTREKAGLSQSQFAKRPHQSRAAARRRAGPHHADSAFLAYIRVINREPEAVERALNAA